MSVKTSISISRQQNQYARSLVEQGRYSSISAVVQQGLDLLQKKTEDEDLERDALRALLKARQEGPFESSEEFKSRTEQMFARKRRAHGLED